MSAWLAAAYAVLALGLAWMLTSRSGWRGRAVFIVCAPALALALWLGRPDPAGWPSPARVPRAASLVWAMVDEPNPDAGDRGRVYLWLDVGATAPRAYSLPYSRPLEEQVQRALTALKRHNDVQVIRATGKTNGRRGGAAGHRQNSGVRFRQGRPPQLPTKQGGGLAAGTAP